MKMKLFISCLAGLVAIAIGIVRASDPVGIYCLISKVVLQPNNEEPTAIQISGAFSFAIPRTNQGQSIKPAGGFGNPEFGDVYGPAQVGYLYYSCAKNADARCVND